MALRKLLISFSTLFLSCLAMSQDLSGTWEGRLLSGKISYDNRRPSIVTGTGLSSGASAGLSGAMDGVANESRLVWELVQRGNKLSGIVYFYAADTRPGDHPNSWYTWEGEIPQDTTKAFVFIQGRYVDGLGEMPVYQFNVWPQVDSSRSALKGSWYKSLETLHTMEKPAGYFVLYKLKDGISDPMWSRWKDKKTREKALTLF